MNHNIIKSLAVFVFGAMLIGTASAQENEAKKKNWNTWIEVNYGVNLLDGSKGFADYMKAQYPVLDYHSSYIFSGVFGIGVGMEYRRFTFGLYADGQGGSTAIKNQYVKKDDVLSHIDLGYRFDLGKGFALHPTAGFGFSTSYILFSTSRGGADYVNAFTARNYVVPLTLNFMAGKNGTEYGVYLQYLLGAGPLGKTLVTGLETEVDGLHFQPSTLTLGCRIRF